MRNYLIFGGRDSRDFGVYISGQGTYGAPEKAYDFYSIPGRNGALIGNERRLENIEVSYECFIYANFDENIANFRSYLLSLDGYQELTDSYHTDEYRLACYVGPFEPEVTQKNDAGSFTLTFNCKPQRFLTSGKTVYAWVSGGTQTFTGQELNVRASMLDETVLISELEGGNNVFHRPTVALVIDGETVCSQQFASNYASALTVDWITGTCEVTQCIYTISSKQYWTMESSQKFYVTLTDYSSMAGYMLTSMWSSVFSGAPYFESSTGRLYVTTTRTYSSADALRNALINTYGSNVSLGRCYMNYTTPESFSFTPYTPSYSGEFNITTKIKGNSTATPKVASYSYLTTTMEYESSDGMTNPTMFPSEPLARVYGSGSFEMDGVTVTVDTDGEYTDIDCELMDCYEGSTNRNNAVTFSTYDFPKLQVGENSINIIDGISGIEITPRWWRL